MVKHFIAALFLFSVYYFLRKLHKRKLEGYLKRDEEARKRYSKEINQPSLQYIQSKAPGAGRVSFLQSKRPTESVPVNLWKWLSEPERLVLRFKKKWVTSKYPQEVADIVDRILDDPGRKDNPITNAVLLGVGSLYYGRINVCDLQQFVLFSQIVAHLAVRQPEILNNIAVQDPKMDQAWKELFDNHGCQVVDHPAGFERVDGNTFLFPAFLPYDVEQEGLKDRPTGEIPMRITTELLLRFVNSDETKNHPEIRKTICSMFDDGLCSREAVPCLEGGILDPRKEWTGPMWGIWNLSFCWRPHRSEEEKFSIRYDAAVKLRFPTDVEDFRQAYESGLSDTCYIHEQDKLIYSFIATHRVGKAPTFAEYFLKHKEGTLREDERYERDFNNWQAIINEPEKQRDRSWMEYLEGDVETYSMDAEGLQELTRYQIRNNNHK